ncbi:hypothetical protein SCHPADRAFT_943134 [Schizopora paradoxa]|uniref:F-box domain-containing protein n=1 Tax=Schizopora paradoxa TaxID=27342 RepID=A0A0H2RKY3_9AGAM|nr:hypothetical protein SCHPADRAFT_943134 [Schizopora paradoxa]
MELSREAYELIVQYVAAKSDLFSLSRVSRAFQAAAERALYNTITMRDVRSTIELCDVLSRTNRVAKLVVTLNLFVSDPNATRGEDTQDSESDSSDTSMEDISMERYWPSLSAALQHTHRLRCLNVHIESGNTSTAWVLRDCTFRLRSFHCDFAWDRDLVAFLNGQSALEDLFLADYATIPSVSPAESGGEGGNARESGRGDRSQAQAQNQACSSTVPALPFATAVLPPGASSIHPHALYRLAVLECSYPDAVISLAPGRPLSRIKTCFSREDREGKERELAQLIAGLRLSESARRIRALDLADTTYTEEFSLDLLRAVVPTLPDLRYLGTLVLPIGLERLQFFGLLRRLRKLQAVELEVTDWEPPPSPQAMRALASELRLYCTTVQCVVFVADFERTMMRVVDGFFKVDYDTNLDNLWREV